MGREHRRLWSTLCWKARCRYPDIHMFIDASFPQVSLMGIIINVSVTTKEQSCPGSAALTLLRNLDFQL